MDTIGCRRPARTVLKLTTVMEPSRMTRCAVMAYRTQPLVNQATTVSLQPSFLLNTDVQMGRTTTKII